MHSTIIALGTIDEDELFERMPRGVDYVDDRSDDAGWMDAARDALARVGALKGNVLTVTKELVVKELERLYEIYKREAGRISCFEDFTHDLNCYRVSAALSDELGLYVYRGDDDSLDTWADFVRALYWEINHGYIDDGENNGFALTGVFDYHY